MSRSTKTIMGMKVRKAILEGVNAIYKPVSLTLGPEGRNALIYRTFNRGSRIVNDGYTVAEVQEPKDIHVRLVAETFKEMCKKTNEKVGDGTTTTAVIGGKLYNDCDKFFSENQSNIGTGNKVGVMGLKRRILESAKKVKEEIKRVAKKITTIEELENLAIISVEDEELGKTIAKMVWDTGVDGFIDVVEGYKGEVETEIISGMRFPAKVAAKGFVNNASKYEMVAKDCTVLVTNYELDDPITMANVINPFLSENPKLILIAPKFSDRVLVDLFNGMYAIDKQGNKIKKPGLDLFPVSVPALRTEQFEDLAIFCGATFIDKNKGKTLRSVQKNDLGFLEKLIVKDSDNKEDATAIGGKGTREETRQMVEEVEVEEKGKKTKKKIFKDKITTAIAERIDVLKSQIKETPQEQFKKLLERRIASIASATGIIRVGDSTQASSLYRKLKIEDGVYACKAALRGGYVKGGGLCLKEIAETLPENDILQNALTECYKLIQESVDGGIEITDKIIDPAETIFYAVEHATSVVANLVTVEIITPEMEDPINGEGEFAIARAISELVIVDKIHKGQLKESEIEMERDNMNTLTQGLTIEEYQNQENG